MARTKPTKETQDEPEFIGPPLIPGRPPFWRWIGYFKVGPGDTVEDIKKAREIRGLETARKMMDLDEDD